MKLNENAISPTRQENYPEWYQQVIKEAGLAENGAPRGSMVIKPWGYAIWENIQATLDKMFKDTGHENAYFPLLIPLSFLQSEAEHIEGFAKECAVVTHHRLETGPDGRLVPAPTAKLEEPLIVRPTSETIIGYSYSQWVKSYRDLPIKINQWANVLRWEMRPRMFLRTSEFLWQEGHTAHATRQEAIEETRQMLDVYESFARNYLALPVIKGEKTPTERFPGAVQSFSIECMMQDRKALQAGTSHFLGQNFARASKIKFLNSKGKEEYAWTTSWGVSTRLIGALVMVHSDDDGLVLPPKVAPAHVVIMPICKNEKDKDRIIGYCRSLCSELKNIPYANGKIRALIEEREIRQGEMFWRTVKKGIPIRLEIGNREVDSESLALGRRDFPAKRKQQIGRAEFINTVTAILDDIHATLLDRAEKYTTSSTKEIDDLNEFKRFFDETHEGGFAVCYSSTASEDQSHIQDILGALKVSAICVPFEGNRGKGEGRCIFTGRKTNVQVIFAQKY